MLRIYAYWHTAGIRVHRRETNVGVAMAAHTGADLLQLRHPWRIVVRASGIRAAFDFWIPNFIFQAVGAVLLWRANRGI